MTNNLYPIRKLPDTLASIPPEQWKAKEWRLRLQHFLATIRTRLELLHTFLQLPENLEAEDYIKNAFQRSFPLWQNKIYYIRKTRKDTLLVGSVAYQIIQGQLTDRGNALATDLGILIGETFRNMAPEEIHWVVDDDPESVNFAFPALTMVAGPSEAWFGLNEVPQVLASASGDGGPEERWWDTFNLWKEVFLSELERFRNLKR